MSRMIGTCPLCGNRLCEGSGRRPDERLRDRGSEYYELLDFSCKKCGNFSVTSTALALLEQWGTSGNAALGLTPRLHPLVERYIVDSSLVEEAVSGRTAIT